jgi:hypothetical protein
MGGGYALELGDYRETERDGYNGIIDGGITITPDEQQQAAMDERASLEEERRQQQHEQQQDEDRNQADTPDAPKEESPNKVENGKCVHGVIAEAISKLGGTPNVEKINQALAPYEKKDGDGKVIGVDVSQPQILSVLSDFFAIENVTSQPQLVNAIEKGDIAFAFINNDAHAVLIVGVDRDNSTFTCYDPVFGYEVEHNFREIRRPVILR